MKKIIAIKWRKPAFAMIIAAVLVCIVAAACLLTVPVEHEAQIRVDGRVYTYTGSEEFPVGPIWEIGMLEGIVHRSGEEPEKDFYGTNLDEKYAGQPIYACLDGRLYLFIFDEWGHFLPFELPKGDIVSGPTEVARGDFNRDGQSDFITVTEYSNSVEIILADSISAKTIWADTASIVEGQQKCFIVRKDEDGDSIIRYTFHEEGYCNYIRFFIGENGELDVEKGRSPIGPLLEASFTDPEAISASLPENSTFLFSTYGGEVVIGPIKGAGSEQEQRCLAAIKKVLSTESASVSKMYGLGVITNRATLFYNDTDWLLTDAGQGYSQRYLVVDGKGYSYEQSGSNGVWYPLEELPAMPNFFGSMNCGRQYTGWEELENGFAICFAIDPVAAGLPDGNKAAGETTERFLFNSDGEFYCLSRRMPLGIDTAGEEYFYIEELSVDYFSAKDLNKAIKEEHEECINEIARREAAITENSVYDDGGDVIAVPYGESVVIDLDGDGANEVLCMKASDIYGIWSLTVNGVEYLDQLEFYLGADLNPEPDQFPNYYIVRTYKGDYSPKICVFDNGPSGDPKTHFFTFNHSSLLQYHGYVPCHVSNLSFDGNHHMTGPARLDVFQTWYAEHTWLLQNNGSKVREVERDFYYVDDFEFTFYPVDGVWPPPSKYTPLLCQVYAYRERDISAQPLVLEKGTPFSILGTDNKEWLLVADKAGREYYLHLCGINSYSVDTPAGETMGNKVFDGLNYAD